MNDNPSKILSADPADWLEIEDVSSSEHEPMLKLHLFSAGGDPMLYATPAVALDLAHRLQCWAQEAGGQLSLGSPPPRLP